MASAAAAKKWARSSNCRSPDQPQVRLVDQRRGVEGVAGPLGGHPGGGELAQLVVHEREEVRGDRPIARIIGVERAGGV